MPGLLLQAMLSDLFIRIAWPGLGSYGSIRYMKKTLLLCLAMLIATPAFAATHHKHHHHHHHKTRSATPNHQG
ncbi:MAG TPA: hypothetical protein VMD25_09515 [Acidobacteriaceae bacterium]|nr:hypothetical protein [Acidobacteriaceae bacterium]